MDRKSTDEKMEAKGKEFENKAIDADLKDSLIRIHRDLSIALNNVDNLNEGLKLCLESALKVSETDAGGIYLRDENSGALDLIYHKGLSSDFVKLSSHYEPDSDSAKLVMAGKPIYTRYNKIAVSRNEAKDRENLRATALLPISHGHQVIGCMNVASHSFDVVPEKSRDSLEAIATQIGCAILRLQATERLRASEEKYRLITENATDIIWQMGLDGSIKFISPSFEIFSGYSVEEGMSMKLEDVLTPDSYSRAMDAIRERLAIDQDGRDMGRSPIIMEFEHKRKDGSIFPCEVSAKFEKDENGNRIGITGVTRNIEERKRSEEALRRSEEKYSDLFHHSNDAIFIHDLNGNIIDANQKVLSLFGYTRSEFLSIKTYKLHPIEMLENSKWAFDTLMQEGFVSYEIECKKKSGEVFSAEVSSSLFGLGEKRVIQDVIRDITERQRQEQSMRQHQKLEAIGTLAGGVAHEINNPVNGIMNYAQLIKNQHAKDPLITKYTDQIIREANRVAAIVSNLITFSGDLKQPYGPTRIIDIIEGPISLIQTIMRHDHITFDMDIPHNLPTVTCRNQQIQQVLMNLIINARDALNAKYPGHDENKIVKVSAKLLGKNGGKWIRTTVEDHGLGIPPEIRDRIFDPFYTTKLKDKGTGLGLSISYSIVKDHHGDLTFESEPGQYTKFHMDLPLNNGWDLEKRIETHDDTRVNAMHVEESSVREQSG